MSLIFRHLPRPRTFERIYERMQSKWLLKAGDVCTVFAFTSRLHREGVSTIVAGLARACGAADPHSVLVLDIAPSRKRVARLLKMKVQPVRIVDIEANDSMLSDLVIRQENLGVDVLTLTDSGHAGGVGLEFVQTLLERLRSNYRVIFIDAGVLTNSKGTHWLTSSNYRVLVVDTLKATREILERQRKELEYGGIALDSAILNKRTYPIPNFLYWLVR